MLFLNVCVFAQFINEGFQAGEAFVQARVKAPGTPDPVIALAVRKEGCEAKLFLPVLPE